ncbi:MAG: alpha amylase [Ruminococcus sp.]|nr:alpha amylase [Ruminococcus sp.]
MMKRLLSVVLAGVLCTATALTSGCGNVTTEDLLENNKLNIPDDKYNNYYQIWVGSFCDSDGDKIGDLQGVISQLDYLNDGDDNTDDDLGVTGIWLSPMMPSPSYHKYDVTDYYNIDEQFGTLDDFDKLIAECNKRNIDVIIDLIPNHCSFEHPWFQKALKEAEKGNFDGYAKYFSMQKIGNNDTVPNGYNTDPNDSTIIYESNFSDQMPEWNYNYDGTKDEFEKIAKFWIDRGVAGFRLDAIRYIYMDDAEKSSATLKWFYDTCKAVKDDIYMVGEDWSTEKSEISSFYASGIDSLFAFPFADSSGKFIADTLAGSINDYVDSLINYEEYTKEANKDAINAYFITNHDMARSADYLEELYQKKMAAALYMLTPGNTYTYYGEELGMETYIESNDPAKRTAMIWDSENLPDVTANGIDRVEDNTDGGGVKQQLADKDSLLNFYKQALKIRNTCPGIARGTISALPDSFNGGSGVGGYYLTYGDDKYLILHNLEEKSQTFEITEDVMDDYKISGSLSAKEGSVKIENNQVTMPAYSSLVLHSTK